ncbi:hypothetical protein HanIR_Chr11g0512241 [Helianthus annuus]|nr:hypothetical protein HanIR_Chr11g0512241 [Helianthus annuus]
MMYFQVILTTCTKSHQDQLRIHQIKSSTQENINSKSRKKMYFYAKALNYHFINTAAAVKLSRKHFK